MTAETLMSPKTARHRAKLTQAEVAARTGITLDTIRKVEQRVGRSEPCRVARRTWERLCEVYGVEELAGVEVRA